MSTAGVHSGVAIDGREERFFRVINALCSVFAGA